MQQYRSACYTSVKSYLEFNHAMKNTALILLLAASTVAASAQTPAKPAAPAAKPATHTAKPATTAAKPATPATKPATTAAKLPFGVPAPNVPAVRTLKKTAFSLQYQEIKIGDGADADVGIPQGEGVVHGLVGHGIPHVVAARERQRVAWRRLRS